MGSTHAPGADALRVENAFEAIHVVSDLHLADRASSEIFKGEEMLAGLIRSLAQPPGNGRAALIINGDFVDFLATSDATYFDAANAVRKFQDVVDSHPNIWAALREFVANPNHQLVIVLGNHDLELSLSDVRLALVHSIAQGNADAQSRIHLALEGTGFSATVGQARVLCVHGNEVDTFNKVDYERLRRLERDRQFGVEVAPWVPNAGTKLVVEVMNGIKRDLPFVDLLKPETAGVLPILFALDQTTRERLRSVLAVGGRLLWDKGRSALGLLSGPDGTATPATEGARGESFDDFLRSVLPRAAGARREREMALLEQAEERFQRGVHPLDSIADERESSLGYFSAAWKTLSGATGTEILLEALERLQRDQSFDPLATDETFHQLDRMLPDSWHFLLAGHTHLERVLQRRRGKGIYMNTGSWARLIRLRPDDLISLERFEPVYQALQAKTMAELDQAEPRRVVHRPAVASVWRTNGSVQHALRRVRLEAGRIELDSIG